MQKLRPTVKRDLSLFSIEAWQKGYTKYLKKNLDFWYDIIFYYDGHKVNFYHKLDDFNYFKTVVTEKLLADDKLFKILNQKFQNNIKSLKDITNKLDLKNLELISELIGEVMSFYIFIVSDDFVNRKTEAWKSREMSEGILYLLDEKIELLIQNLLVDNNQSKALAHFLNLAEITRLVNWESNTLDFNSISSRMKSYILFKDKVYIDLDFFEFCSQNEFANPEIEIEKDGVTIIKGDVACSGLVTGPVKIIIKKEDLIKIELGDIMVSIMTNASFTPYLSNVAAIITDEGGITCHAAIISRELKIPCITGTKIATKVLKDGDIIEVDAEKGLVRKL